MTMHSMRTSVAFCIDILLSSSSNAQDFGYERGYVVTTGQDTIPGEVKYMNSIPFKILEDIKFKPAKKQSSTHPIS